MYEFPDDGELEALADEWTINRLLAGDLALSDAPDGLGELAVLVHALNAPARPAELIGMEEIVSAATTVRRESVTGRDGRVRRRHFAIAAALSTLGLLVFGSGLAAANVLPDPAQRFASDVLAHVGVHVDHRDGSPAPTATTGKGATVSGIARTPTTGPGKGAAVSGTASNGQSRAVTPSTTPPVSTPPVSTPPVSGAMPTTAAHPSAPTTTPPRAQPPITTRVPPTTPVTTANRRP
jgi:hypothetical protein